MWHAGIEPGQDGNVTSVAAERAGQQYASWAGRAWLVLLAVGAGASIGYVIDAEETRLGSILFVGFGLLAVGAMVAGIAIFHPAATLPWALLAAGLGSFVLGDIAYYVVSPAWAEVPYLGGYVFLVGGVVVGGRRRGPHRDRGAVVDALMISIAMFAVVWTQILEPGDPGSADSAVLGYIDTVVFPLLDLVLLLFLLRYVFRGRVATSPSGWLVVGGVMLMLASDLWYSAASVDERGFGTTLGYGAMLFAYGLVGASALHPTMAELFEPDPAPANESSVWRLAVVLVTPFLPAVIAIVRTLGDEPSATVLLAGVSGILYALAFVRLSDVVKLANRAARTDETLREYAAALLTAASREESLDAARVAAHALGGFDVELRPAGTSHGRLAAPVKTETGETVELVMQAPIVHTANAGMQLETLANGLTVSFAREAAIERERSAAEALRKQNERLLELDAMKQSFVSMVSHELRTPLTSIVGYLELLREGEGGELTADQARFLEVIDRNATRLQKLVDDILTVSRADANRMKLTLEPVDVTQLVRRSVESAAPVASGRRVELLGEPAGGLPGITGDPGLLAQVLDNLVSNAVKFTPAGGTVWVRAACEDDRGRADRAGHGARDPA